MHQQSLTPFFGNTTYFAGDYRVGVCGCVEKERQILRERGEEGGREGVGVGVEESVCGECYDTHAVVTFSESHFLKM